MPQATAVHRALDGASYLLRGDFELDRPATSVADVVVGDRMQEFTSGIASLADDIAASLGLAGFDEEFSFHGGTLRTAVKREYTAQNHLVEETLLVTWTGQNHSLVTRMYHATVSDAIGLLRTLGVDEQDDGLYFTPDDSVGLAGPATVIKEVPRLGLLEMARPGSEQAAQLPPWKGVPVTAGELYRDTLANGQPFFVLSAQEVWATLVPLADTDVDAVPTLVDGLNITMAP